MREILETHFRDMQDLEFTIEDNRLYILQTRNGKGPAWPRSKSPSTWSRKGRSARRRPSELPADSLSHVLAPIFDKESVKKATEIASKGLPAGPGQRAGGCSSARRKLCCALIEASESYSFA